MENAEHPPEVDAGLREIARNAWTFGLLAIGMAVMIPCTSYLSALAALPLGLVAVGRARGVLEAERKVDEATEVYARTGRILGLMAAGVSGTFLALVVTFILLYAFMVAAIFGFAATVPTPPPAPVP